MIQYLEAENAYTDAMTRDLKPFQEALYMLSYIKQTDLSVPDPAAITFTIRRKESSIQFVAAKKAAWMPRKRCCSRLVLLDRGMAYAIAHIRGGDDMGEAWHDNGKLMNKKNTFYDFIDCAQYLIGEKWTSKDRLVIEGGSAGGLLMGAVVNMRPDLFRAVHLAVPFVDVVNDMMDPSLPLTTTDYPEWGNPKNKTVYEYILSYSPYDNLHKAAYPAMLLTESLNDSQVMYWEAAKFVAS